MAITKNDFANVGNRIPSVDLRAMDLFWPQSTGGGFNGPMRLVALLLMTYDAHGQSETYWDHDQIADRTGLSVEMVADALDKLRQVNLVRETTVGPKLTWNDWDTKTRPQWLKRGMEHQYAMRPTRPQVSPHQDDEEIPSGNDQVEARGAGSGADGPQDGNAEHASDDPAGD